MLLIKLAFKVILSFLMQEFQILLWLHTTTLKKGLRNIFQQHIHKKEAEQSPVKTVLDHLI